MFGIASELRQRRRKGSSVRAARGRRPSRGARYALGGDEPTVEELICDPVTTAIMAYDHVSPAALRALVSAMRARLNHRHH